MPSLGREPSASLGFVPFSAIIDKRDKRASNLAASRPQVFSTSQQDFVWIDLWIYSTPQALVGSGPSELNIWPIGKLSPTPCFFAVTALHDILPIAFGISLYLTVGLYPLRSKKTTGPLVIYTMTGFHLGIGPTLKLFPGQTRLTHQTVSPAWCESNSLGLLSFRVSLFGCPGTESTPFWGYYPL